MFKSAKRNINRILSMVLGCLLMVSAYTNCASNPQVTDNDDDEKITMVATK